jgi:hypothetical protein
MSLQWRTIVSETVGTDRKITLPPSVLELFVEEEPTGDERVFWSVETEETYLVISDEPLTKPQYEFVAHSGIYDEGGSYRIRPPESVPAQLRSQFYEGSELLFLSYEAMATGDGPNSTFLLSQQQASALLPGGDPTSDLGDRILDTPGFVPPAE